MFVSTCRVDVQPDLRRGYTLHITNLEDRWLDYLVTFVMTARVQLMGGVAPPAADVERFARFMGDGYFVEQPFRRISLGTSHPFEAAATYTAGVRFPVGARKTGRIGIEPPEVFRGFRNIGTSQATGLTRLEGYVTLRLPPARTDTRRFVRQPQADRPVRVLVNPETRTLNVSGVQQVDIYDDPPPVTFQTFGGPLTYDEPPVKRGFTWVPGKIVERTEPLHIGTGKAENELEPEGARSLRVEDVEYAREAVNAGHLETIGYRGAETVPEPDRAGALIELLCEVGQDPALTAAINQGLTDQQAAIRLTEQR